MNCIKIVGNLITEKKFKLEIKTTDKEDYELFAGDSEHSFTITNLTKKDIKRMIATLSLISGIDETA